MSQTNINYNMLTFNKYVFFVHILFIENFQLTDNYTTKATLHYETNPTFKNKIIYRDIYILLQ